jgi:hypothetical protein
MLSSSPPITADMIILDVVSTHPKTEEVFKSYDEKAGVCICCQALFEPLEDMADRFGLNLEQLLIDLNMAARTVDSIP